jgi:hypothetical protein
MRGCTTHLASRAARAGALTDRANDRAGHPPRADSQSASSLQDEG